MDIRSAKLENGEVRQRKNLTMSILKPKAVQEGKAAQVKKAELARQGRKVELARQSEKAEQAWQPGKARRLVEKAGPAWRPEKVKLKLDKERAWQALRAKKTKLALQTRDKVALVQQANGKVWRLEGNDRKTNVQVNIIYLYYK